MAVRLDITNALAGTIGDEHGITDAELAAVMERAPSVIADLESKRTEGTLGFFELPYAEHEVKHITDYAAKVRGKYRNIVLLGIGGSALGPLVLQSALNHPQWNLLPIEGRDDAPRFFLVDNTDPELLAGILDVCQPETTLFIVVSKSGSTVETVAAFRLAYDLCKARIGDQWTDHFALVTDPAKGWLRDVATECQLPSFVVPPNVGGRFSVLSAVGLLPAALLGLDVHAILRGAARANEYMADHSPAEPPGTHKNWPYTAAAINYLADTAKGKHVSVMMPYAQALKDFADWYAQLWAESLGKKTDAAGNPKVTGQTVVKALGATDQHSQLQLFLEGPNDKVITLVETGAYRRDLPVPEPPLAAESIGYLDGHTFTKVIGAELEGTRGALTECQRPNVTLHLDALDGEHVGELLMGYQIATAVAGELHGINAFDQPGVELGKVIAKRILSGGAS